MDIAIIGSGQVGQALADASIRAGHEVTVSSADPEGAEMVARATGARAVGFSRETIEAADVVVLAVPDPDADAVLNALGDAIGGKIVVDATESIPPDYWVL